MKNVISVFAIAALFFACYSLITESSEKKFATQNTAAHTIRELDNGIVEITAKAYPNQYLNVKILFPIKTSANIDTIPKGRNVSGRYVSNLGRTMRTFYLGTGQEGRSTGKIIYRKGEKSCFIDLKSETGQIEKVTMTFTPLH